MARDRRNVKLETAGDTRGARDRCLDWLEAHPYTGWYIAIMATVNVVLNLIDAFDLF